jgi:hypothetical protein
MRGYLYQRKVEEAFDLIYNQDLSMKTIHLYEIILHNTRKGAVAGNVECQFLLGTIYQDEDLAKKVGVKLSNKKAIYWYRKACLKKHPLAYSNLAYFYKNGIVVSRDLKMAYELYFKSYDLGISESGFSIAMMYFQRKKYREAKIWLNKIIQLDEYFGEAMFELARFYNYGLGVEQSYSKAYELYKSALNTEYITQYTKEEIFFEIGKMYFFGNYLSKSIPKAKYLIELSNQDNDHENATIFLKNNVDILKNVKKKKIDILSVQNP